VQAVLSSPNGWKANLSLGFEARDNRTVLARRRHTGPLVVQRPFYPEGDPCHVYLLHPPGGVVGGDQLSINVDVGASAHALITTPAAGKFYRSGGWRADLQQHLTVHQGGVLEWLPQETILFSGCQVNIATKVQLASGARFIGWEILCLGRPAAGEQFDTGSCRQCIEVERGGLPLFIERSQLSGGSEILTAPWGFAGYPVAGTLIATPCGTAELEAVRDATDYAHSSSSDADGLFSATLLDDVLVCRYLGQHGELARNQFIKVWTALRPALLEKPVSLPRVWNT
jgi:urease accessory protein